MRYGMEQATEGSGLWCVYLTRKGGTLWYGRGGFVESLEERTNLDFFSACRILNNCTVGAVYQTRVDMDVESSDFHL